MIQRRITRDLPKFHLLEGDFLLIEEGYRPNAKNLVAAKINGKEDICRYKDLEKAETFTLLGTVTGMIRAYTSNQQSGSGALGVDPSRHSGRNFT